MTVVPCEYACSVCHYCGCHLHQLRHFAFLGLLYPIQHDHFSIVLIDLRPDFPELFFQAVCLRQGLVHGQRVVKPRLILLVKDVHSIAQQQVACAFQHLTFVDVFFHVVLHPAYFIQLLVHKLYHMEMVKHVHRIWAILIYRGDKGGREVCCNIFDVNTLSSDPFPKAVQGICSLAVTDMKNTAALQVNHDCLVHMPSPDCEFIYADAVHSSREGGA